MNEKYSNGSCFVVIEGTGEGVGKSHVAERIQTALNAAGHEVIVTRQPGGTIVAEKMRDIVKATDHDEDISSTTEYMLFAAARAQLDHVVIKPALKRGAIVISDRHLLSTHAYQGMILPEVDKLVARVPDVTVFVHAPLMVSMTRTAKRKDDCRIERKDIDYFSGVHERAMAAIERPNNGEVCRIDTTDFTLPSYEEEIENAVSTILSFVEGRMSIRELEKTVFDIERVHVICMGDVSKRVAAYRGPKLKDNATVKELKERVLEHTGDGFRVVVFAAQRDISDDTLIKDLLLP